jgi:hypothetical protein
MTSDCSMRSKGGAGMFADICRYGDRKVRHLCRTLPDGDQGTAWRK